MIHRHMEKLSFINYIFLRVFFLKLFSIMIKGQRILSQKITNSFLNVRFNVDSVLKKLVYNILSIAVFLTLKYIHLMKHPSK
jgi:hypothetical protein